MAVLAGVVEVLVVVVVAVVVAVVLVLFVVLVVVGCSHRKMCLTMCDDSEDIDTMRRPACASAFDAHCGMAGTVNYGLRICCT